MLNQSHTQDDKIFYSKAVDVTHSVSALKTVSGLRQWNPIIRRETLWVDFSQQLYGFVYAVSIWELLLV